MSSPYINDKYEYWRILFGFSEKEFNLIKKDFIKLELKTGEYLYKFNELPKGIILINKGTLRLIGKDENKEFISIAKFKKNEIASARTILSEKNSTGLIASNDVEGFFIKKEQFLKLSINN